MTAVAISLALLISPAVLWVLGYHGAALAIGFYAFLSIPSIVWMLYISIKQRAWPKITGGPSIVWLGKRK
ncbi:MAG: hypothetical protein UX72_C0030G0008 [Parcubacteria group bacterium GW2011_GWA2_47_10]|nr:MAG: hypothetical protein UX72_C0030G0008 [Parcubacteria group bacterium GW2011_GWA2_47_10]